MHGSCSHARRACAGLGCCAHVADWHCGPARRLGMTRLLEDSPLCADELADGGRVAAGLPPVAPAHGFPT